MTAIDIPKIYHQSGYSNITLFRDNMTLYSVPLICQPGGAAKSVKVANFLIHVCLDGVKVPVTGQWTWLIDRAAANAASTTAAAAQIEV